MSVPVRSTHKAVVKNVCCFVSLALLDDNDLQIRISGYEMMLTGLLEARLYWWIPAAME